MSSYKSYIFIKFVESSISSRKKYKCSAFYSETESSCKIKMERILMSIIFVFYTLFFFEKFRFETMDVVLALVAPVFAAFIMPGPPPLSIAYPFFPNS
jgi:hypothetical protein